MSYYTPDPLVTKIHNTPRFNGGPNSWPPVFTLNADSLKQDGPLRQYLIGIIGYAGVYIVIGIIAFVVLFITLSCICCCRKRRNASGALCCCNGCRCRPRTFCYAPYYWTVFCAALFIMVAIALSEAVYMRGSLTDTVNAVINLANAFIAIGSSVLSTSSTPPGLTPTLLNIGVAFAYLQVLMNGAPLYQPYANQINGMAANIASAASDAASVGNDLTEVGNSLKSAFSGANFNLSNLNNQVFLASIIPLALFLVYLFFFAITMCPNKCGAMTFRICNFFLMFILFLVFLFSAVFIIVSFFGGDFCYSPSGLVSNLLNATDPTGVASSTVGFYTGCQNPAGVYAPITSSNSPALQFLVQANQSYEATTQSFITFGTTVQGISPQNQTVLTQLDVTGVDMVLGQQSMNNVLDAASCAPINNAYNGLLISFCGSKGIGAIATLWVIASVACAFIFLLAVCGIPICLQHPGDDEAKEMMEAYARQKVGGGTDAGNKTYANQAPPAQAAGWGTAPGPQGRVEMIPVASGAPAAYV